jgi:hypothetical protein
MDRKDDRRIRQHTGRIIQEGGFHYLVITVAMKAGCIKLRCISMCSSIVRILVMSYQVMQSDLWGHAKCEDEQKQCAQKGSYDWFLEQII